MNYSENVDAMHACSSHTQKFGLTKNGAYLCNRSPAVMMQTIVMLNVFAQNPSRIYGFDMIFEHILCFLCVCVCLSAVCESFFLTCSTSYFFLLKFSIRGCKCHIVRFEVQMYEMNSKSPQFLPLYYENTRFPTV